MGCLRIKYSLGHLPNLETGDQHGCHSVLRNKNKQTKENKTRNEDIKEEFFETVTIQLPETRQGAKQSHESFWEQQKTHPLMPRATCWTCHQQKQDTRCSKSKYISMWCRAPKNPLHDAIKYEKGVNWQETGHGGVKQNSQSSMCAISQTSS